MQHIGTLEGAGGKEEVKEEPIDPTFLHKTKWRPVRLATISHISHDTRIFRFALQSPDQDLGLPTGQHVFVRLRRKPAKGKEGGTEEVEGELVQRAYTPVSDQAAKGFIDLLIKYVFTQWEHSHGLMPLAPSGYISRRRSSRQAAR